ncbi:MAG TPA: hypothetical protein VFO34_03415 [Candidatus Acidoferrales bacterium]|nr:hypothetical protein [Candidatus Acidoferrales bacterium]
MARYPELIGRRVDVEYRAGDVMLPATGTLVADSGKSIFLEEKLVQRGQVKNFRWEIPYRFISSISENFAPAPVVPSPSESAAESERSRESAAEPGLLKLRHNPNEA